MVTKTRKAVCFFDAGQGTGMLATLDGSAVAHCKGCSESAGTQTLSLNMLQSDPKADEGLQIQACSGRQAGRQKDLLEEPAGGRPRSLCVTMELAEQALQDVPTSQAAGNLSTNVSLCLRAATQPGSNPLPT